MGKIVGGTEWDDAETTPFRQSSRVGCGKDFVDSAVTTASDDAINLWRTSPGNGFAGQPCRVARLPSDPHLHNVTVVSERVNSCPQASIIRCLAVQNNADIRHGLRTLLSEARRRDDFRMQAGLKIGKGSDGKFILAERRSTAVEGRVTGEHPHYSTWSEIA
jgi:hypothetical protein